MTLFDNLLIKLQNKVQTDFENKYFMIKLMIVVVLLVIMHLYLKLSF